MGKGLGLISMGERLEAIGGTLEIRSKPGAGTRLEVSVPLRVARPERLQSDAANRPADRTRTLHELRYEPACRFCIAARIRPFVSCERRPLEF